MDVDTIDLGSDLRAAIEPRDRVVRRRNRADRPQLAVNVWKGTGQAAAQCLLGRWRCCMWLEPDASAG